jgi:hypothetical protein
VNLFIALLLTIAVEFIPVYLLTRKTHELYLIVLFVVVVNALTNPVANVFYSAVSLWVIETAVIAVEAVLYTLLFRVEPVRGLLISIAANIPSIIISIVLIYG